MAHTEIAAHHPQETKKAAGQHEVREHGIDHHEEVPHHDPHVVVDLHGKADHCTHEPAATDGSY